MNVRRGFIVGALLSSVRGSLSASDYKYIPGNWLHELGITRLAGYRDGEFLVLSDIIQQRPTRTIRHHLEVKISALDKMFTATGEPTDTKHTESLTILLHATADPMQFEVEFDHTVFDDGKQTLRFAGMTILPRW